MTSLHLTLTEQRDCYADELAKVIAPMFDGRQLLEASHQLYELIFKTKKAYLIRQGQKYLQSELRQCIKPLETCFHAYREEIEQSAKAKAYSYSDLKSKEGDIEESIAGLVGAENIDTGISSRDIIEECIDEITQLKCLAALTDFREQADIYAGHLASGIIGDILDELRRQEAFVGTLGTQDIHRIIKTMYLNITPIPEMENLARFLGRYDIIEKYLTPLERWIAERKEKKEQIRLLTVLSNRIVQKSQQIS